MEVSPIKKIRSCPNYNWADLPKEIIGLIHNKLEGDLFDQLRFRAVCKSWRSLNNYMDRPYSLPWVICYSSMTETGYDAFLTTTELDPFSTTCKFLDPYAQRIYELSDWSSRGWPLGFYEQTSLLGSKNGWMIFGHMFSLFCRNFFTNHLIKLPKLGFHIHPELDLACRAATFTVDPTYPESEILGLFAPVKNDKLYIGIYSLHQNHQNWYTQFLELLNTRARVCSVLYMDGILYCLFNDATLKSYNLEDRQWRRLTSGSPISDGEDDKTKWHAYEGKSHLLQHKKSLIMIYHYPNYLKSESYVLLFKFDWSQRKWVSATNLKHIAIFISQTVPCSVFSAPLVDENGEKIEDCRVFYFDVLADVKCYSLNKRSQIDSTFKCYSVNNKRSQIQSILYGKIGPWQWPEMSFIEPPWVAKLFHV